MAPPGELRFEDLYGLRYSRMVALARLMIGDLVVAEEVVQDAFVQLYRNWSSVESWRCTGARSATRSR